jgi:K+-transporting ATPase KdpC subunit
MSATQLPPVQADEPIPSPRRNTVMAFVRPAIMMTLLLTIITGLIYPGIVTVLAQVIFPSQANGSLLTVNGKVVGSDLIGQQWTSPRYFHGRPSATVNPATGTPEPYAADNSAASNLGPTNKQLINGNGGTYKGVKNYADQFRKENGLAPNTPLPSDIVTGRVWTLISPQRQPSCRWHAWQKHEARVRQRSTNWWRITFKVVSCGSLANPMSTSWK